jgi:DinB superfamily/Pentapeptide repeats (8 copies)
MDDFVDVELRDARFERVDLHGAHFQNVDLSDAQFRSVDLSRVVMRGVDLIDVAIHGEVENLVINGVDVVPLIEAELDRRYPERPKMRPTDAEGFRAAWVILDELWAHSFERARRLTTEQLNESVDGEWSFIQTIRHLSYATDCWIRRAILGDPSPWDPLDWPPDEFPDAPEFSRDLETRPSLDTVLELRRSRTATVREYLDQLADESLDADTTVVDAPGWPPPKSFPVRGCLLNVLNEEFLHRLFAERDFDILESR